MPNGHVHYEAADQLIWLHTEQGYPDFRIHRYDYSRCVRILHLTGVRGYAPSPRWETFPSLNNHLPKNAQRESVEALATHYVEALRALLTSNPSDPLTPHARIASMAWFSFERGWAIVLGDYHLYVRAAGEPLRYIEVKPGLPPDFEAADEEQKAMWLQLKWAMGVGVDGLLAMLRPEQCVHDLRGVEELLCSTTPLHEAPSWERASTAPVFDDASAAAIVSSMREHGLQRSSDQLTLRWRRPSEDAKA